jgi:hypothetical protein
MTLTADISTAARRLTDALNKGLLDEADAVLACFSGDEPRALLLPAAELHLRRHRFAQAIAIYDRLGDLDIHARLKRNAAKNFAALQVHRPADFQRLIAAPLSDRYRLAPLPGHRITIADFKNPAHPVSLTPGSDPVRAVQQTYQKLESRMKDGAAIGLLGIGDGYLLGTLGRITPRLFMDMALCIHLIEPDLSLINTCLMLHDLSGSMGPIEQQRFVWHIGPEWHGRYRELLHGDLMLPQPAVMVQQSTDRAEITPRVQAVSASLAQRERSLQARNKAYYAGAGDMDADRLAAVISGQDGGRKPRVMLMTSRFTTVLQYATRGAAEGFAELGWETKLLIEPTTHHQIARITMREAVATFKPDLVFQIDHLRPEHEDTFPPRLPFACWIQDHLPNLTDSSAGRAVGPRDYVLTFASPLFVDTYDYPSRQCIDMPMMLTTPRRERVEAVEGGPDLVYVSNVSVDPRTLTPALLSRATDQTRDIVAAAAKRLLGRYENGGAIANRSEVRVIIDEATAAIGGNPLDGEAARQVVEILWNPLNIALYRQQALAWVADAADSLDLTLGIYGRGWETHPRFARHARGAVEHGDNLARLTASARINLNLEPYACFTHHRLLDGLVAGGFFIIRDHPGNTLLQELLNFLEDHLDGSVQTADQSRLAASGSPALAAKLNQLLARAACITFEENADPVRQVRCWQRAGVLIRQATALPHLGDVTFNDAASCRALIEAFINDPSRRAAIARSQRQSIEARMSFAAGMRLVADRIAALLRDEKNGQSNTASEAA